MNKFKLILVDDEPWALLGLKEIIDWEAEGFEITAECSCATEALERSKNIHPDALITDIKMPDMTGIELIQNVRKSLTDISCMIVSAYSDFDIVRDALRLNAIDYILKPLDKDEVLKSVRKLRDKLIENEGKENDTELVEINPQAPVIPREIILDGVNYLIVSDNLKTLKEVMMPAYPDTFFHYRNLYGCLSGRKIYAYENDHLIVACSVSFAKYDDPTKVFSTAEASFYGNFLFADAGPYNSKLSVADVQHYLFRNLHTDVVLKDLAAKFFVNETYLCDIFKEETGETVMNFLKKVRVNKAKRYLKYTHESLTAIAEKCGYKDYSYFGKQFKTCVGMSPENYRKSLQ